MGGRAELVWYGDDAPPYDHGPMHPLRPARVVLTRALIHDYGIVDGQSVVEIPARDAEVDEILLVHSEDYVEAVRQAGHGVKGSWWQYGFGPGDNPVFPRMHEAARRVVGASLVAAEAVWSDRVAHAFNPSGGLHHAMPDRASGFCVYDDPAVAIAWLLRQGASRVAYVDVDVHHGDGPQAIFWDDPRVLTVSLHQSGATLFPGTGFVDELGSDQARGTKVNVPLPPHTGDAGWLDALRRVVPPLVEAWKPDVLVTQLGCDTHATDPLANLLLTTAAYRQAAALLHELAHRAAGGRWVATGGGGYQWGRVVPRAWTTYFAEMAGVTLADELPAAWLEKAGAEVGGAVPTTLSEPTVEAPPDAAAGAAEVVGQVESAVFPLHQLSP